MRRFSQRNSLVTLSDINITPLLDLAFVLLIIFVITTPLLEKGLPLKLSKGGTTDEKLEKKDIRVLEITARGEYALEHHRMSLAAAVERNWCGNFMRTRTLWCISARTNQEWWIICWRRWIVAVGMESRATHFARMARTHDEPA